MPTDSLDELAKFRVGPQALEGGLASELDEIRVVFLIGSLEPGVAIQIRSMLLSLWGYRYMIEHAYLDRHEAASIYSAFLIPALARARGGLGGSPSSRGSTYVLNHLFESGAIAVGADGRFKINAAAADTDITRAATEFISLMAKGDATAVESLLQRYVVVTPTIRDVLARLGPAPPLQRPVYRTADRLTPPAR